MSDDVYMGVSVALAMSPLLIAYRDLVVLVWVSMAKPRKPFPDGFPSSTKKLFNSTFVISMFVGAVGWHIWNVLDVIHDPAGREGVVYYILVGLGMLALQLIQVYGLLEIYYAPEEHWKRKRIQRLRRRRKIRS